MARKVVAEFDAVDGPFNAKVRMIEAGVARFEKGTLAGFSRIEAGMNSMLAEAQRLRAVGTIVAGSFAAGQFTGFIDASTSIRNQLRGIGADSEDNFQKLYLAATRSIAPFDAFSASVVQMQKVMGDKQPLDVTIRQMETLSKLMAAGGKGAEERASTILQFTQALQSGVLQGDELRSLRENAPVEFLRAIAREAGGTLEDLKTLGAESKITTDVMIRALDSLAATADQQIGKVTLTFADAFNVLRNGALVAAQSFDSGSGMTRAAVSSLSTIGDLLASSAGAMEMFGKAVAVAGTIFAGAFAGRKIADATQGLSAFFNEVRTGESARQALLALRADVAQTQAAVATATDILAKKQAALTAAQAKGTASAASLARAQAAVAAAERNLGAQREALVIATDAVTAAETRLTFAARATAAAGALMRTAWAFLGGWPGLLLIAGTAALTFASNMRTAADVANEAKQSMDASKAAISDLTDVQDRLNEALRSAGAASDVAHRQIMANTLAELGAKRALLEIETAQLVASQKTQQAELDKAQAKLAGAQRYLEDMRAIYQSFVDTGAGQENILGSEKDMNDAAAALRSIQDEIKQANANLTLTGLQLQANNEALATSAALFAKIEASQAMEKAAGGAQALAGWLDAVGGKMANIAGFDLSGPFAAAADWARKLYGWTAATAQVAPSMSPLDRYNKQGELNKGMTGRGIPTGTDAPVTHSSTGAVIDLSPQIGGGGGGGGQSQEAKDQQAALDFINQMMTAEEQRAQKLQEMTDLRARLVAETGAESDQVKALDQAIQRYADDTQAAAEAQAQLFDDLSTQLANAITDWTDFGSVVRSILASLVQSYGPDFFTALFTPGKQTGSSTGTYLGNLLTGQMHSGGVVGSTSNARSVPAGTFTGAPRFHNGLMPDEFAAILQKGETVLPKGVSPMSPSVSITMPVDMRGADPSMKPYIDGQMAALRKELPRRVVEAVKTAQKSRSL